MNTIPRMFSQAVYTLDEKGCGGALASGEIVYFFDEVPNMEGHALILTEDGKPMCMHIENFVELADEYEEHMHYITNDITRRRKYWKVDLDKVKESKMNNEKACESIKALAPNKIKDICDKNLTVVLNDISVLWDDCWYYPDTHEKDGDETGSFLKNEQRVKIVNSYSHSQYYMFVSEEGYVSQDFDKETLSRHGLFKDDDVIENIITDKQTIIYYAHCLAIYGTEQEKRDIKTIQKLFPNARIYNPNNPLAQEGYKELGMDYFLNIIKKSNILVFRGLPNMKIPAGVWTEIDCADANNIPIVELPCLTDREMSVENTRFFLKEIGQR